MSESKALRDALARRDKAERLCQEVEDEIADNRVRLATAEEEYCLADREIDRIIAREAKRGKS